MTIDWFKFFLCFCLFVCLVCYVLLVVDAINAPLEPIIISQSIKGIWFMLGIFYGLFVGMLVGNSFSEVKK